MTYNITFSKKALRQLKKMEKNIQIRIVNALKRIRIRPEDYVMKLVGDPGFKLRVGDYRVILDLNTKKRQIQILKIGHRKNIYER